MMRVRPIRPADLDDLHGMAEEAGVGVTTLPADRDLLARRIQRAQAAFAGQETPGNFLFALEDMTTGRCVGVSAIDARVGLDEVWYNYRLMTVVNACRELGIHVTTPTLFLSSDMTGATELCSLYLRVSHRFGGNGALISRARFLFLADFPDAFAGKVFAEMRGYSDAQGLSPFWEALGRKFFSMDFHQADVLTGMGQKSFIAELMPKHPIYLSLLPEAARVVVGEVHPNTRPALAMLQAEGFHFGGLVDIFDAGPVVEAPVTSIRAVRESFCRHVLVSRQPLNTLAEAPLVMVSNRSFQNFRVGLVPAAQVHPDTITLPLALVEALDVSSGDLVRIVPLKDARRTPGQVQAGGRRA